MDSRQVGKGGGCAIYARGQQRAQLIVDLQVSIKNESVRISKGMNCPSNFGWMYLQSRYDALLLEQVTTAFEFASERYSVKIIGSDFYLPEISWTVNSTTKADQPRFQSPDPKMGPSGW